VLADAGDRSAEVGEGIYAMALAGAQQGIEEGAVGSPVLPRCCPTQRGALPQWNGAVSLLAPINNTDKAAASRNSTNATLRGFGKHERHTPPRPGKEDKVVVAHGPVKGERVGLVDWGGGSPPSGGRPMRRSGRTPC